MAHIYVFNMTRKIAHNTIMLYIRMILIMMISLYTSRIVLEALGITDFGILNLVGGIVTLLSFLNASMVSTIQRFLTYELGRGDLDRLKLIFKTSLAVQFVLVILVIIIAETVGLWFLHTKVVIPYERFEAALWVYHFSILTCIISIISAPYSALIISYERMSAFAYISILEVLFKLFIAFGILYIAFDKLKIYIVLSCLVQLIIRIVYGIYCKRFETVKGKLCWNSNIFKEIIHFTSWNTLGSIAYVVLTQGINVVLNLFFGPVVNAARAIAMQVQSAITQFYMSFQTAVNPQITKSFAKNDFGYVNNLIIKSAMFSLFLLYFIALPIYLQTDVILKIWLKTVPEYTTVFIKFTILIGIIESTSSSIMTVVRAIGHMKIYQIVISNILMLSIPIIYILLKFYPEPIIAYIIWLNMVIIAQVFRIVLLNKMMKFQWKRFLQEVYIRGGVVVIGGAIIPILLKRVFEVYDLITFIFYVIICMLSASLAIFIIGLQKKDKKMLFDFLKYDVFSKKTDL